MAPRNATLNSSFADDGVSTSTAAAALQCISPPIDVQAQGSESHHYTDEPIRKPFAVAVNGDARAVLRQLEHASQTISTLDWTYFGE